MERKPDGLCGRRVIFCSPASIVACTRFGPTRHKQSQLEPPAPAKFACCLFNWAGVATTHGGALRLHLPPNVTSCVLIFSSHHLTAHLRLTRTVPSSLLPLPSTTSSDCAWFRRRERSTKCLCQGANWVSNVPCGDRIPRQRSVRCTLP